MGCVFFVRLPFELLSVLVLYLWTDCGKIYLHSVQNRVEILREEEKTMQKKIIEILRRYTKFPAEEMGSETHLVKDLGLNSYDVITIITDFEDEFDIEIDDRDIRTLQTIGDVVRYIEGKQ